MPTSFTFPLSPTLPSTTNICKDHKEKEYDDNGNLKKKINEDGRVDYYTYDDLNQLIRLEQGSDIYEYRYDGEKERIEQTYTDTKDYHIEVWYNEREPFTIVKEDEIEKTFLELREKVEQQEIEKVCEPNEEITRRYQSFELRHELFSIETLIDLIRYYVYPKDEVYYREAQTTEYIIDRNREYSEVLAENETIHVYGNTLIESENASIITGWNNDVILEVSENETKTYRYDDYGNSENRKQGHGYKQEIKDQSGLIYNRARYYDPKMGRFIQIDNHYQGESDNIASQNRYAYCLNNPYKYVDRDGNSPFSMLGGGGGSKGGGLAGALTGAGASVINQAKPIQNTAVSKATNTVSMNSGFNKVTIQTGNNSNVKSNIINNKKPATNNKNNEKDSEGISSKDVLPKIKCLQNVFAVKNVYTTETIIDTYCLDLYLVKFLITHYQKSYDQKIVHGRDPSLISYIKESTLNTNEWDISVERAIELLGIMGISVSLSWTELSFSAYTRIGNFTIKLSGFLSLNLIWGMHGFRVIFENNIADGIVDGWLVEASAHTLVIVGALLGIYGVIPGLCVAAG